MTGKDIMKIIETLSEKISEEIEDAKAYAEMAIEHREDHPDLAQTLYDISTEEISHMNRLHNAVVKIIEDYRQSRGEPPAEMMAVYDYLHKKQIDKAAHVKMLQAMFNEN